MENVHAVDKFVGHAEKSLDSWDAATGGKRSEKERLKAEIAELIQGDANGTQAKAGEGTPAPTDKQAPDASEAAKAPSASDTEDKAAKRLADKDRYITQLKDELAQYKTTVDKLNAERAAASKPKLDLLSEAELEAYLKQNPAHYKTILSLVAKQTEEVRKELLKEFSKVEDVVKEVANKEMLTKIMEVHPDAVQIRDSDEFKEWYETQPAGIKDLFGRTVADVIEGLTIYKERTKAVKKAKEDEAAKAKKREEDATPLKSTKGEEAPPGEKIWTESEVLALPPSEYKKYASIIDKQMKEGKLILDVSKRR